MLIHSLPSSNCFVEALYHYFALRVAAAEKEVLTLRELLRPLFPNDYKPAEKLARIQISSFKVLNQQNWSCFVDDNSNYRTDIIVWGFDPEMGIDIALLGWDGNEICPVVFKCNSRNSEGLRDSVLTLSPGLQFLNNAQRSAILRDSIQGLSAKQIPALKAPKMNKRKKFEEFMNKHPQLATKWTRVSVTVSKPDMTHFNKALEDESDVAFELLEDYEESPLVPLTFYSDVFLTKALGKYIKLSDNQSSDLPELSRAYYPVSIKYANESLPNLKKQIMENETKREVRQGNKHVRWNMEGWTFLMSGNGTYIGILCTVICGVIGSNYMISIQMKKS